MLRVHSVSGDTKRASDYLDQHMGAGNWILVLRKSSQCSYPLSHLSRPTNHLFFKDTLGYVDMDIEIEAIYTDAYICVCAYPVVYKYMGMYVHTYIYVSRVDWANSSSRFRFLRRYLKFPWWLLIHIPQPHLLFSILAIMIFTDEQTPILNLKPGDRGPVFWWEFWCYKLTPSQHSYLSLVLLCEISFEKAKSREKK